MNLESRGRDRDIAVKAVRVLNAPPEVMGEACISIIRIKKWSKVVRRLRGVAFCGLPQPRRVEGVRFVFLYGQLSCFLGITGVYFILCGERGRDLHWHRASRDEHPQRDAHRQWRLSRRRRLDR